jgi:hypothetical protein
VVALQIAGMFVLTCIGWLIFRESDIAMLGRAFTLTPWDSTTVDRELGLYLFLVSALYALPLWIDSVWSVFIRPHWRAERPSASEPTMAALAGKTLLAGLAFALLLVFRSQQSLDFIYFQFRDPGPLPQSGMYS